MSTLKQDLTFPEFWKQVDDLPDFRDPRRVCYSLRHLVGLGLLMVLSLSGSRRAFEEERKKGRTKENLGRLIDEPCDQVGTTWAVDYLLRGMPPSGVADMRTEMVRSLINARRLEDYRFDGEYLIAVDGTEHHRFKNRDKPHCSHCLHQLMMHMDVNAKRMQEGDRRKFPDMKTGLQAFKSLKALGKAIGGHLRHACIGWHALDRDFARGIQLRFVFDTS